MTVFEPVRAARRAWERTAPQLTLEVDEPTSLPGGATTPLDVRDNGGGRAPRQKPNTNEGRRTSYPGRAPALSQE